MEAIKQEPYEIIDTNFGDIVSCEAVPHDPESDSWFDRIGTGCMSGNPLFSPWAIKVVYANGVEAFLESRGFEIMESRGMGGAITKRPEGLQDGEGWKGRFGNSRLLATVASRIRDCTYLPCGPVELLPEDQCADVFTDCQMRDRPCDIDKEWSEKIEKYWEKRWTDEGKVVHPDKESALFEAKWWWAHSQANAAKAKADSDLVEMCDGSMRHSGQLTDAEKNLLADPDEPDDPWANIPEWKDA